MKNIREKFNSIKTKTPKPILKILRFCIKVSLIFLIPYSIFYIYTFPLRAKQSYQREITINFEYGGKDYVMKPVVTCINGGVTMNEGSMEFYNDWWMNYNDLVANLHDGEEIMLHFQGFYGRDAGSRIFERKIKGHASVICDAFLIDDAGISKVDRVMKNTGSEEDLLFHRNKMSLKKYDQYIKNKEYSGDLGNIIYIISTEDNLKNGKIDTTKGKHSYKTLDIQIKSITFGEKKIIKNYNRYLPFFLDPRSY